MSAHGLPPHVRLANEIARQFAHRPPADAATAIANHMKAVWDPRMKQALIAHVASGATDLDPRGWLPSNSRHPHCPARATTAGIPSACGMGSTSERVERVGLCRRAGRTAAERRAGG